MPVWKLDDGIHIGEIIKPHSYLGRARVAFFISGLDEVIDKGSFLFFEWNEKPVPYFIEEISWLDDKSAIIKFADVESEDDVLLIKNKSIYISQNELPDELLAELDEAGILEGYTVYNKEGNKLIGEVTDFIENDMQSLLAVNASGKEILIPFHESIILEIDHKKKKIIAEIPEGLLEL